MILEVLGCTRWSTGDNRGTDVKDDKKGYK